MASQSPSSSFLGRMQRANQDVIASAKKENVRIVSSGFLLEQRLVIPIFQRRYCWGEVQWRRFLEDVSRGCSHSLGRVTCAIDEKDNGRLLIIDGQQRNTTTIMLLSAIRDSVSPNNTRSKQVIDLINSVLCPDQKGLEVWSSHAETRRRNKQEKYIQVRTGERLDFTVMIPTYLDRAAFFQAILPSSLGAHAEVGSWMRPLNAKRFFMKELQHYGDEKLFELCDTALTKLQWLFFPIDLSGNDGTEDLQVVYERLALRDSTFCRPQRKNEYADMGAIDFIRNLLLGSFTDEDAAIEIYHVYWLPIEHAADSSLNSSPTTDSKSNPNCGAVGAFLENMMKDFLSAQPRVAKSKTASIHQQFGVGGHLYADFRGWFKSFLKKHEELDVEAATVKVLKSIHEFSLVYFSESTDSIKL